MLVDANLRLSAVDQDGPFHAVSRDWLTVQLNGRRVGIAWAILTAFVRSNPARDSNAVRSVGTSIRIGRAGVGRTWPRSR